MTVRRFTYEDRTFELVQRPLFPEMDWVERAAGMAIEDMTSSAQTRALILISLRRGQLLLTWEDFEQMSPTDFKFIKEPVADPLVSEPADPQAADAEVGSEASEAAMPVEPAPQLSPSSPTSTGSTSSGTFI